MQRYNIRNNSYVFELDRTNLEIDPSTMAKLCEYLDIDMKAATISHFHEGDLVIDGGTAGRFVLEAVDSDTPLTETSRRYKFKDINYVFEVNPVRLERNLKHRLASFLQCGYYEIDVVDRKSDTGVESLMVSVEAGASYILEPVDISTPLTVETLTASNCYKLALADAVIYEQRRKDGLVFHGTETTEEIEKAQNNYNQAVDLKNVALKNYVLNQEGYGNV